MRACDLIALLPMLITAYGGLILMALVAFKRSGQMAYVLTLALLAAAFGSIFAAYSYIPRAVTPLILVDRYSLYFNALILGVAFLITLLSRDYLKAHERRQEAYFVLLLFAVLGMQTVVSAGHFVTFFLGLEVLSVSLYGLIAYTRGFRPSLEGAIKYLVMAASSSAFLLFGIALIYAQYGTMDFRLLTPLLARGHLSAMTLTGMAMVLVGFAFKLAIAPFHMWSPDVYQGAGAPVTALIATGSKGAVLALLLRLASNASLQHMRPSFTVIEVLAIATMFVGNLLALLQTNVKRLLAYSSIAQIGYMLIPLLAGGATGASSIAFYLFSYFITTVAAFGVIAVISASRSKGDVEDLEEYRGLAFQRPLLAAILGVALLSLTGIPLTSGFIAKFYIFTAAARSGLWALLIIGVVNSGISAFYYLRVITTMYTRPEIPPRPLPGFKAAGAIAVGLAGLAVIVFGIYPVPILKLAAAAVLGIRN